MGFTAVSPAVVELSQESITRWINMNVLVEKLPLNSYPADVIK